MSELTTIQAAQMLGVSPSMVRAWEMQFGFPEAVHGPDGRRRFDIGDVEALRRALKEELSVYRAVERARREQSGPNDEAAGGAA